MIFLTTLIFSLFASSIHANQLSATNIQDDLARFQSIATRCRASMATTTDRRSFDHFKAIVALYKKHAFAIKNRDLIDADELYETYKECSYGLQAYITTRQLLQQTREHTQSSPPLSKESELRFDAGPNLSLDMLLDLFATEHAQELLTSTTPLQTVKRVIAQCLVESATLFAESQSSTSGSKQSNISQYPSLQERLRVPSSTEHWKSIATKASIASARVALYYGIDETVPRGVSSYTQRLMELVIPPLFGALFMQFLGKPYLFKGLFRVFTRFMMVRGLLSPGHPLYSFLNSAAYILPCCIGITGKDLIGKWWKNESINSENITTNLLLDTASSMIIYDALPKGVDRLIPRSMQLNPAYRRKALKTVPREWIAKLYEAMNTQAFASS